MDVTKPYKFIGFGSIHGPKPYKFMGFRWALMSQTPVLLGALSPRPWVPLGVETSHSVFQDMKGVPVAKPYEFIRFGATDVTKPYEFIGFGREALEFRRKAGAH